MLTQVFASAVFGIDAVPITIEVHIDAGIGYHLVGLPDNTVKESNYRIAAALTNTNYKLPESESQSILLLPTCEKKGRLMICQLPLESLQQMGKSMRLISTNVV